MSNLEKTELLSNCFCSDDIFKGTDICQKRQGNEYLHVVILCPVQIMG